MPDIPIDPAEAGLFKELVGDLLREPAAAAEDAAEHDSPRSGPRAGDSRGPDTTVELRRALARGDSTYWLTRRALIEAGPYGKQGLRTMDMWDVKVSYEVGTGYRYDDWTNIVYVDLAYGDAAQQLVHELTHAEWLHTGRHADIATTSRNDFTLSNMDEETDATFRQVQGNIHRQTVNPHLNLPDATLQREFTAGSAAAVRNAQAAAWAQGRTLTAAECAAAGERGGRDAIYAGLYSGAVVTSIDGKTAQEYMGDEWDLWHGQK